MLRHINKGKKRGQATFSVRKRIVSGVRLSKDGRLGDPKIGLLDYMLRSFDSKKG